MKRFLDLLKKHYEKLILGVVLLGLLGAVLYLPFKISNDRQAEEARKGEIINRPVKEIPALDHAPLQRALNETREKFDLNLAAPPHNTVNPIEWRRRGPDGPLIKMATGSELGPRRVAVTRVNPLYLTVSFESIGGNGGSYLIRIEDQTQTSASRRTQSRYLAATEKLGLVTLKEVKPANTGTNAAGTNAPQVVVEFGDTRETATLALGKPFRRVAGYTVDLKYDPDSQSWRDLRTGASIKVSGDDFTVAAINLIAPNQYEVVLSAKQTGKKTTLKFNAVPQS